MVREIDATWNPIYDNILVMYKKLIGISDFVKTYRANAFLKRAG